MNQENSFVCQLVLVSGRPVAPAGAPYSLEAAARLAAVHPDLLRYYCLIGLLGEKHMNPDPDMAFDDNALYTVRRIEYFRRHHDVGRRTLRLVAGLLHETERLQSELRFLRNR